MIYTKDHTGDGFIGLNSGGHYKLTNKKNINITAILAGTICVVFGLFILGIVFNVKPARNALESVIAGKVKAMEK